MKPRGLDHPGLWAVTAPPGPKLAPPAGVQKAEIAVVGAGFTGLAAVLTAAGARLHAPSPVTAAHWQGGPGISLPRAGALRRRG